MCLIPVIYTIGHETHCVYRLCVNSKYINHFHNDDLIMITHDITTKCKTFADARHLVNLMLMSLVVVFCLIKLLSPSCMMLQRFSVYMIIQAFSFFHRIRACHFELHKVLISPSMLMLQYISTISSPIIGSTALTQLYYYSWTIAKNI